MNGKANAAFLWIGLGVLLVILGTGLWSWVHPWREATCAAPRTCAICGKTEGEALPHTWREADCITPRTCDVCGKTEGEALGHTWQEATCLVPQTCAVCGATLGKEAEHTWQDATCLAPQTCAVCGATKGKAADHTWQDATCELPESCAVCGKTTGDPLGHKIKGTDYVIVTASTCVVPGQWQAECRTCHKTVTGELALVGHTPTDWTIITPADLTTPGTRTCPCAVCGAEITERYSLTDEERETLYKKTCQTYRYKDIARSPDSYKGSLAKFSGTVIQVMQETSGGKIRYTLRVDVSGDYSDILYVTYTAPSSAPRILDDDRVTLYGELSGDYTYTTVLGASITLPYLKAEYVTLR